MPEPLKLHRFREERGWKGSQPIVGIAEKNAVISFVSTEAVARLFGGYIEYEHRQNATRFVGVWSDRTLARFAKFLRERTEIEVVPLLADDFRQLHRASYYT